MNMKKIAAMLLCVCMVAALAAWGAKQSAAFSNYAAGKTADEVANNAR